MSRSRGFAKKNLINVNSARTKGSRRRRHVEPPRTVRDLIGRPPCLLCVLLQPGDPAIESQRIILTKILNLLNFEAVHFSVLDGCKQRDQVSIGKNMFVDEGITSSVVSRGGGDSAVEKISPGPQELKNLCEVKSKHRFTNVLEHANTCNLVVGHSLFNVAIVANPDRGTIVEILQVNSPPGPLSLTYARGDTESLDAEMGGCIHHEAAPAASDVQKSLSRLQHELSAEVVQFSNLRRLEILFR